MMRPSLCTTAVLALLATVVGGCDSDSTAPPTLDATGTVAGLIWLDRNGNGRLDGEDRGLPDVRVALRTEPDAPAALSAASNNAGQIVLREVPVGNYVVTVDSGTVGDSLRLLRIDSARVTVAAEDTIAFTVAVTYPTLTIDSAREAAPGTWVFLEGRALNAWGTFGDSIVHIRDSTGAIRLVRLPALGIEAGDSLRALGTIGVQAGQPALRNVSPFFLEAGIESPPPIPTTTGAGATAGTGTLAAELVRVDSAVIQDTTRNAFGEMVFTVDDGTGPLEVVLDRDVPFFLNFGDADVLGTPLDVVGLLKPVESPQRWVVKPRGSTDLRIRDR